MSKSNKSEISKSKLILVIGATCFIGLPVVKRLLEKDYKTRCLIRTDSNLNQLKELSAKSKKEIIFSTGNLQSEDSIFGSLKDADAVIYLVDLKNKHFIRNFLRAISRTKTKRAIFLSSTTVLVPLKSSLKDLKIESENLIQNSRLDYTILRPAMIYGSRDDRNYSKMINFIKKRGFFVIFGRGDNLIQPIYIEDVANAVADIIDNGKTFRKTYEICGKEPLKYRQMLQIVKRKMDRPFRIIKFPAKLSKFIISLYAKIFKNSSLTPDMIERMEIDKSYPYDEAKKDFDFKPLSFENGIEKLIKELDG
jgi:nucleoside-diphosphate-sugar epimerase